MPDIFVQPVKLPEKPKNSGLSKIAASHLHSFYYLPKGMHFETQQDGEEIILLLRKHPVTVISWLLITVILIVTPLFLFPFLVYQNVFPPFFSGAIISFLFVAWYLGTFSYVYVNFLIWYFTVSIVTNERIIDIDFANILHKKLSETRIPKIEDVTMESGGFAKAFFDFGDIYIQTAGTNVQFGFISIPRPQQVITILNHLMEHSEEGTDSHT